MSIEKYFQSLTNLRDHLLEVRDAIRTPLDMKTPFSIHLSVWYTHHKDAFKKLISQHATVYDNFHKEIDLSSLTAPDEIREELCLCLIVIDSQIKLLNHLLPPTPPSTPL